MIDLLRTRRRCGGRGGGGGGGDGGGDGGDGLLSTPLRAADLREGLLGWLVAFFYLRWFSVSRKTINVRQFRFKNCFGAKKCTSTAPE